MTRRESIAKKEIGLAVCALVCLAGPAFAAVSNVVVSGVTNTQAVLQYTAPDYNACTVEVSESASYAPLDFDVDPSKFTNAGTDLLRSSTVVSGKTRIVVVGRRVAVQALDGWVRSRALQQNAPHFYRITCGSNVTTGTFNTAPLPLGGTYADTIPANASNARYPAWPQVDWTDRNQTLIDPQTGILHKRVSFPGQSTNYHFNDNPLSFGTAYGPGWTNPANAILTSGAGATVSGSSSVMVLALYAPWQFTTLSLQVYCAMSGSPAGDDAVVQISMSDTGLADYGPYHNVTCPSSMPGTPQNIGDAVAYNVPGSIGYMPFWIDNAHGQRPVIVGGASQPFPVSISGANIVSPGGFDPFTSTGRLLYINTSGGFRPLQTTTMVNNTTLATTAAIGGAWAGNSTITSVTNVPNSVITTAGPHQFVTGDYVVITGVNGLPPGNTWFVSVLSPTTFQISDSNGNIFDGSNVNSCCSGAVLASQAVVAAPSVYFRVRKKTASANTLSFRAQYSVMPDNTVQLNAGGGGVEQCPPRGQPDGMYINAIDSSGNVAFAQLPHGFTIGSSVAITLAGTISTSVDGTYTANIVDSSHAQINSWSLGNWAGEGYMFQPGAPVGYICKYITAGATTLMNYIFPTTGETRNLGYLAYGPTQIDANVDLSRNPYLQYLVSLVDNGSGDKDFVGGYYFRTRDIGMQTDPPVGSVSWRTLKSNVIAAIKTFEPLFDGSIMSPPESWDIMDTNHFLLRAIAGGAQDKIGWGFVLDSTGTPVGATSSFNFRPARFSGLHGLVATRSESVVARALKSSYPFDQSYQGPWTTTLQTNMSGPPFSACPSNILTAPPFPAIGAHCTAIQVSSTTPRANIPSGQNMGPLVVGDVMDLSGEWARVVQVTDSTHVIVQRQFSLDHYAQTSCAAIGVSCSWTHSAGASILMPAGSADYTLMPYGEQLTPINWWHYGLDAHGSNANDPAGQDLSNATVYYERAFAQASHFDFKSHIMLNDDGGDTATGTGNSGSLPPGNGKMNGVRICPTSDQRTGCLGVFTINANPAFSGMIGPGFGDNADQHLSLIDPDSNFAAVNRTTGLPEFPFYMDHHNIGIIGDGVTRVATLASGAAQVYKLITGDSADNKRLPLNVSSGNYQLADVSAPSRVLADNNTDQYHFCVVAIAGECWAGSIVGERYANVPYATVYAPGGVPLPGSSCTPAVAGPVLTICAYVNASHIGRVIQYGMQRQDRIGDTSRALSWGFATQKGLSGNPNARALPSGDWAMFMSYPDGIATIWLAKMGAYPPLSSVNRTDFIPVPIPIPAKPGATAAVIDYGFDETFHCTGRTDGCVATGNATSDANPFYWASETYTGAACSSGCKIPIPAISGRTVFYRTRYLNSSGATIATGNTSVIAVP